MASKHNRDGSDKEGKLSRRDLVQKYLEDFPIRHNQEFAHVASTFWCDGEDAFKNKLKERGWSVRHETDFGRNFLMEAAYYGKPEMMDYILQNISPDKRMSFLHETDDKGNNVLDNVEDLEIFKWVQAQAGCSFTALLHKPNNEGRSPFQQKAEILDQMNKGRYPRCDTDPKEQRAWLEELMEFLNKFS